MVSRAVKNTEAVAKTRNAVDYDAVEIGTAEVVSSSVLRRGGVPEDHPLVALYNRSWEEGVALRVSTGTPELVETVLRKIATQFGKGLSLKKEADSVTFLAKEKKGAPAAPISEPEDEVLTEVV